MRLFSLAALLLSGLFTLAASAQEVQGLVVPFKSVIISSPVLQEVIAKIMVEEGDLVEEGQVIVQLRQAKEELQMQEAQRIVENAEFVSKGLSELERQKMGSREQALKAQTELALAKIRLALAQELHREKAIRSPLSGIVVRKFKETGESVDRAEKIMEIIDIDQLYAQFYLDPKYLSSLKQDQTVQVRFPDMKGTEITARISFIEPRIDASSGLFRVKVLFKNSDRKVKAGMKAVADFSRAS